MAKIENLVELESGARIVQTGEYKGVKIEVVTGYFIVDDNYPVHVFLHRRGQREKVDTGRASGRQAALEWGFQRGAAQVDSGE